MTWSKLWLIEEEGPALAAESQDQLLDLGALAYTERGGRLVHDHQLGAPGDRPGDGDDLSLAAGHASHGALYVAAR